MRSGFFRFLTGSFLTILVLAACGGGEDAEPTATARPVTSTSTPLPSTTASPVATGATATHAGIIAAPAGIAGTVLEKAIMPPIELDSIRYGGTVTWPTQFSNALDPKLNNSGIGPDVRPVYEKLVHFQAVGNDPYMQVSPGLAESWSSSSDLMTYTFKLRKGVKWHNVPPVNGREFVAADAVYSMNRYREKDSVAYGFYVQVESIEAPDNYTVVVKIKEPTAYLVNDLFANLDYMVPQELVAQSNGTLTDKAIGTGPFIMKRFQFRQGSSHVRNPDYWKKDVKGNPLPYIDALEVPFITDGATSIAAFRSGQLDFPISATLDQIIAVGKTMNIRVYRTGVALGGQGLTWRTNKSPWNDVRVRRAFNHALDKDKYGDIVEGQGRWIYSGPLPFSLFFGRPATMADLGPYAKYDPAEAKRLLIEAGYKDGKLKVPTPLVAAQGNPYGPRTAAFQALYKDSGIEIELLSTDFATYNPLYFNKGLQDIGLTHHILPQPNLNWYAQAKWHPDASQNTAFINDVEVNRVLKEIKTTIDPAKIREYAKFLWDFDTLGSYTIWTPVGSGGTMSTARIRNHDLRAGGQGFFTHVWLAEAPRTSP